MKFEIKKSEKGFLFLLKYSPCQKLKLKECSLILFLKSFLHIVLYLVFFLREITN